MIVISQYLRAVVVITATRAPNRFVRAATHDTPQKPHAAKTTATLELKTYYGRHGD